MGSDAEQISKSAEYSRRYRQRHPERARENQRRYRQRNPRTPEQYRASNERARRKKIAYVHSKLTECVDCGTDDIRVLEWDHRVSAPENKSPTYLAAVSSYAAIDAEIAKCDIRCANCHSIRHHDERESRWQRSR